MKEMTEKTKIERKEKTVLLLVLKIFFILFLLSFIVFKTHSLLEKRGVYKEYKDYVKGSPDEVPHVEVWMSPFFIEKHFGIENSEIELRLNKTLGPKDLHSPLQELCDDEHISCEELVLSLQALEKK